MSVCATIKLTTNGLGPTQGKNFLNQFKPLQANQLCPESRVEHFAASVPLDTPVLLGPTSSGLFNLCLYAFAEEKGLLLTPDDIYLHILQRVAEHVNQNAGSLREKFVSTAEKQTISVRNDFLKQGDSNSPWHLCFHLFENELSRRIVSQVPTTTFSTTRPIDSICQTIALMDMVQSYFKFQVFTRCGIVEIALAGTPSDWSNMYQSINILLKRVDMDWWLARLDPILQQFCNVANGANADTNFWSKMVRLYPEQSGGGPFADGWILDFFPYIKKSNGTGITKNTFNQKVELIALPSSISRVPFLWDYFGTSIDMMFLAGLAGVFLDQNNRLASVCAYSVVYGAVDCTLRQCDYQAKAEPLWDY